MTRRFWTPEEDAYMREAYATTPTSDMAAHLNRSKSSVFGRAELLKLRKSEDFFLIHGKRFHAHTPNQGTRFKTGNVPFNKGRKQSEWLSPDKVENVRKTQFKKGSRPHNTVPVGTERISKDGYIEVKVSEDAWKYKHRVEWEKHHGAIPAGHNVQMRDGNRQNWHIDNLYLISKADNMARNTIANYPEPLRKTMKLVSKLTKLTENETDKH
jgi:hypothetical protein